MITIVDSLNVYEHSELLAQMHRLRARVFHNRLGWDVMNFVPVPGHWGTLPLSVKGAPNGTTATEVHRRL